MPDQMVLSIDTKATVKLGYFSREGRARAQKATAALDHDMGKSDKMIPVGILEVGTPLLHIGFGTSAKTSDLIVDQLEHWQEGRSEELSGVRRLLIKCDNGPECASTRTQFMKRMVEFSDQSGLEIRLLYYPPYHSKYNPIERCWGVLERHWNGTLLDGVETVLNWAGTMTWKGIRPVVNLMDRVYEKGVTLTKSAMREVEARLERNPNLPKWDVVIKPRPAVLI